MGLLSFVILTAAALTGALIALGLYGASQVISPPRCDHRDDPENWGLPCDEVEFPALDGPRIKAWLARAAERGPAVIVVHGHGGNRHTSLAHASFLFPSFSVLLPDLRGHGESDGRHTSVGYFERRDVIAAAEYLRSLGYGPIGVLGISMGGAAAILAAAESAAIDAVISDSTFAALRLAVQEGARLRGYPGPITRPLAYLSCRTAAWRLGYRMQAGDPLTCVAALSPRPLLLIHGGADQLVRVANAQALFGAAGEPKELWVMDEVDHARGLEAAPELYRDRVMAFFGRYLLPPKNELLSATPLLEVGPLQIGQPAADAGARQMHQVA
jgi:uncharacterized protein